MDEKHTSLHRFKGVEGYEKVITSQNSKLKFMGFDRLLIQSGETFVKTITEEEVVLVLIEGDMKVSVSWNGEKHIDGRYGKRKSVYKECPYAVYLPPGSELSIESENGMEARLFCAPCQEGNPPYFCTPDDVDEGTPGALNMKRKYRFIFGPPGQNNDSVTKKLIVGESVSSPGGWIGFPAHRHDYETSDETELEEVFSFKVRGPRGGYIIQHSYELEPRWDEFNVIEDDLCAVALPKGYHTSMAVPGCVEYLLWGLAGDKGKEYVLKFDHRLEWIREAENLFSDF